MLESIAIYFVILYHGPIYSYAFINSDTPTVNASYYLFNTILSTAVPLFFFVNGYLLFSKRIDLKKHFRKIIKLIILMFVWGIITIIALMLIKKQILSIREILEGAWYIRQWWNNHFWFIGALVCIYFLFPVLKVVFDNNKKIFIYLTLIIVFFTFGNTLLNQIVSIFKVVLLGGSTVNGENYLSVFNPFIGIRWWTFTYFCLGGISTMLIQKITAIPTKTRNIIAILSIILNCTFLFCFGLFYSYANNQVWDLVFNGYDTIFTLFNTICIFILCLNYKSQNRIISTISQNTLGIFFIHWIIISLTLPKAIKATLPFLVFPATLLYSLIVLFISLAISLIIQKIPFIKKLLCF